MVAGPPNSEGTNRSNLPWHQFSLAELTLATTIVAIQCAVTTRYLELGLPLLFLVAIPASYRLWCVRSDAMRICERMAWTELWAEAVLSVVMACILLIPWLGVQLAWGFLINALMLLFIPNFFPVFEVFYLLAAVLPPWCFLLWLMRQCAIHEW